METCITPCQRSAVDVWREQGLRPAREQLGLSLRELGDAVGSTHTTVRAWERDGVPYDRGADVERVLRSLDVVTAVSPADVRILRRRLRCSHAELGARVGVSKALVVGWEHGAPIRLEHTRRLRRELECAPSLAQAVRDWHGWTAEEFGRELGVSSARVGQWLRGASVPSKYRDRLAELAELEPAAPSAAEFSAWRRKRKLGTGETARRLGVQRSRISRWESGASIPARYRGPLRRLMRLRLAPRPFERRALELIEAAPGGYTDAQLERVMGRAGAARSALAALRDAGEVVRRPGVYEDMPGRVRVGRLYYVAGAAGLAPVRGGEMTGAELTDRRKQAGVSIAALARELGVSRRAVRYWEGSEYVPLGREGPVVDALEQLRYGSNDRPSRSAQSALPDLRQRRLVVGLIQVELAERLDVEQSTVSAWERGVSRVSRPAAERIEKVLAAAAAERVTPDELRAGRLGGGWTQAEFAERLGVKRARLRRWELGLSPIRSRFWPAIRRELAAAPAADRGEPMEDLSGRRGRLRWSQHELADRLGVWQADVSRWERGAPVPTGVRERLELVLDAGVAAADPAEARRAAILALVTAECGLSPKLVMRRVGGAWGEVRSAIEALEAVSQIHVRATRYLDAAGRSRSRPGLYAGPAPAASPARRTGAEIVLAREELLWSQAELARQLGFEQAIVWRWEHEVVSPDAGQVEQLDQVLAAGARELAGDRGGRLEALEALLGLTRERLGLSVSEMARRLQVDRGTYAAWEYGRRPVSSWRRREVLAALDQLESSAPSNAPAG